MTSKINPNLSRLKCIGYKYGYDDFIVSLNKDDLYTRSSEIVFYNNSDPKNVSQLSIHIPLQIVEWHTQTNNFNLVIDYIEHYLKTKTTELDIHYV